jgi:hypothetical protein
MTGTPQRVAEESPKTSSTPSRKAREKEAKVQEEEKEAKVRKPARHYKQMDLGLGEWFPPHRPQRGFMTTRV